MSNEQTTETEYKAVLYCDDFWKSLNSLLASNSPDKVIEEFLDSVELYHKGTIGTDMIISFKIPERFQVL